MSSGQEIKQVTTRRLIYAANSFGQILFSLISFIRISATIIHIQNRHEGHTLDSCRLWSSASYCAGAYWLVVSGVSRIYLAKDFSSNHISAMAWQQPHHQRHRTSIRYDSHRRELCRWPKDFSLWVSKPNSEHDTAMLIHSSQTSQQWMYPCGGMPMSTNRSLWPVSGGAVALQPGWFQGKSSSDHIARYT